MRIVVVGASSGLGRSIALGLGKRGEQLALLARRRERLEDAAAEIGGGALAVACDVTDEASCRAAVDEAAAAMGGIDGLVYTPGVGHLARLVDIRAADWRRMFDTNVVGAALVTAAAVRHLQASSGVAAFLSSVSASMTPPWPGLGGYAVSKSALDTLIEAWRQEHPAVGFTRVVVGDCAGGEGASMTEFANQWDWDLAAEMHPVWQARDYLAGNLLEVEELVRVVELVLGCRATACVPSVTITPRHRVEGIPDLPADKPGA